MTTIHSQRIPAAKMKQFHEILCATGGRYMRNPRLLGEDYLVDYKPGDYVSMCSMWQSVTTAIVETRKRTLTQHIKHYVRRILWKGQ